MLPGQWHHVLHPHIVQRHLLHVEGLHVALSESLAQMIIFMDNVSEPVFAALTQPPSTMKWNRCTFKIALFNSKSSCCKSLLSISSGRFVGTPVQGSRAQFQ